MYKPLKKTCGCLLISALVISAISPVSNAKDNNDIESVNSVTYQQENNLNQSIKAKMIQKYGAAINLNFALYGKPLYSQTEINNYLWKSADSVNGRDTVLDTLARVIYAESSKANIDSDDGRRAVARVIMNRKDSDNIGWVNTGTKFTYKNIVFSTNGGVQFESVWKVVSEGVAQPYLYGDDWINALYIAYYIINEQRGLIGSDPLSAPNGIEARSKKKCYYFLKKGAARAENAPYHITSGGNTFFVY